MRLMIVRGCYRQITLGIYVRAWLVGAFLIIMALMARSQTKKVSVDCHLL